MGRYTGPVCRRCRREGMKLFLKGTRCNMAKCPIDTGRPAPGMHGQRRGKKPSDYGMQLHEKQRLRFQYGMQEAQFRGVFKRALRKRGVTGETLLQMLETRLDNLVFRFGFATSRRGARCMVTHGHVRVNGRRANVPSMVLKAGDAIQVREKTASRELAKRSQDMLAGRDIPSWLVYDPKNVTGTLVRIPSKAEIAPIANEQLVVELYSK